MSALSPFDRRRLDRNMAEARRLLDRMDDPVRIAALLRDSTRIALRATGQTDEQIDAEFARQDAETAEHLNDSPEDFIAWADSER